MYVMIARVAKRLAADTTGGAAVIVAVALPVVLGFAALGLEYGSAIVAKSHNQRTSDIAAFAAAFEYNKHGSVDASKSVALSVASLNGVSSGVSVNFDNAESASYVDVVICHCNDDYTQSHPKSPRRPSSASRPRRPSGRCS